MKDINHITDEDMGIVAEHSLRADQLRNIQRIMNGSMTPKKLKAMETEVLPRFIMRERNARSKAQQVMKKYGMVLK